MGVAKKETGFTLVEVLIAIMILGIVFISVLTAFKQSYSVTWQTHERTVAVNLAREKLEFLKRYDGLNYARGSSVWALSEPEPDPNNNGLTYNVITQVIPGVGIYNSSDLIPVRATVSWTSHGRDFSINIDTCYVKKY